MSSFQWLLIRNIITAATERRLNAEQPVWKGPKRKNRQEVAFHPFLVPVLHLIFFPPRLRCTTFLVRPSPFFSSSCANVFHKGQVLLSLSGLSIWNGVTCMRGQGHFIRFLLWLRSHFNRKVYDAVLWQRARSRFYVVFFFLVSFFFSIPLSFHPFPLSISIFCPLNISEDTVFSQPNACVYIVAFSFLRCVVENREILSKFSDVYWHEYRILIFLINFKFSFRHFEWSVG